MESGQYMNGNMDKETVLELLRKEGFRVTRQRKLLIEIILQRPCTCCKEIYYLAKNEMTGIGMATLYRTITALEKVGALKPKSAYQLCCCNESERGVFRVELEDESVLEFDHAALKKVLESGLEQSGYLCGKHVKTIRQMPELE